MSGPEVCATSIEALPDVYGETTTGLYVIATENATRYLVLINPDGPNRAIRLSWYGLRCEWRPFAGAWVYAGERFPTDPIPVRVGEMMMVQFTRSMHDYYRSGMVTEILSHDLSDARRLTDLEATATAAMLETAADIVVEAYRAGRLRDAEDLAEVCAHTGVDLAEVRRRLP